MSLKKPHVDYENEDEMDWIQYIDQSLSTHLERDSPFPYSSWSYARRDSPYERGDSLKNSDEVIRKKVIEKLYATEGIDASGVEVNVLNASVLLSGKVSSEKSKGKAITVTESVEGVWKVINELEVTLDSYKN